MTRDELIRIAIQCQLVSAGNRDGLYMDALAEFAKYVAAATLNGTWTKEHWTEYERDIAAAEREECAKVCDSKVDAEYATGKVDHNEMGWTQSCAIAIRARGQA